MIVVQRSILTGSFEEGPSDHSRQNQPNFVMLIVAKHRLAKLLFHTPPQDSQASLCQETCPTSLHLLTLNSCLVVYLDTTLTENIDTQPKCILAIGENKLKPQIPLIPCWCSGETFDQQRFRRPLSETHGSNSSSETPKPRDGFDSGQPV